MPLSKASSAGIFLESLEVGLDAMVFSSRSLWLLASCEAGDRLIFGQLLVSEMF